MTTRSWTTDGWSLQGCRIVELAGIGPGPFAAMMLSDMGAEVLRVDRAAAVDGGPPPLWDVNARGRRSVGVDLKHPGGAEVVLRLVERADALIEGFRPGVTERLGVGPDECLARRPSLVYGRMTGWGQSGPYAQSAGRDINYVALSGTLAMIGRSDEAPTPPLNLLGDFGGGGMLLAFGVVCGIHEASRSGRGQVVDAAMVDGAAVLAGSIHGLRAGSDWGTWGAGHEPARHRRVVLRGLRDGGRRLRVARSHRSGGLSRLPPTDRSGRRRRRRRTAAGPDGPQHLARDEASGRGADADQDPRRVVRAVGGHRRVLRAGARARRGAPASASARTGTFTEVGGVVQPAPAPRFDRTQPEIASPPPAPGAHTDEGLADWGFSTAEIDSLRTDGVVR